MCITKHLFSSISGWLYVKILSYHVIWWIHIFMKGLGFYVVLSIVRSNGGNETKKQNSVTCNLLLDFDIMSHWHIKVGHVAIANHPRKWERKVTENIKQRLRKVTATTKPEETIIIIFVWALAYTQSCFGSIWLKAAHNHMICQVYYMYKDRLRMNFVSSIDNNWSIRK